MLIWRRGVASKRPCRHRLPGLVALQRGPVYRGNVLAARTLNSKPLPRPPPKTPHESAFGLTRTGTVMFGTKGRIGCVIGGAGGGAIGTEIGSGNGLSPAWAAKSFAALR
jgi:hypothetical protein